MKELIAFLLLWIGAETNYNVNLDAPRIIQLTQQELNTLYYKEDQQPHGHLYAFYDPKTDTVFLNKDFDIHDPFQKSVLLHELIHYVQDNNDVVGPDKRFTCIRAMEEEAYPLQKKYMLEVHGVNWKYDELWVKLLSSCEDLY
tara:strand:+ start:1191 stop:1619 length:429 start_codon:yes stop_codon:yes gene_type:complete